MTTKKLKREYSLLQTHELFDVNSFGDASDIEKKIVRKEINRRLFKMEGHKKLSRIISSGLRMAV